MPDSGLYRHGPWIVPLAVTILIAGFNVYSLIERVEAIELKDATENAAAMKRLSKVEWQITEIRKYCCENKVK